MTSRGMTPLHEPEPARTLSAAAPEPCGDWPSPGVECAGVGQARTAWVGQARQVCLVPDLGHELLTAMSQTEELLLTLAAWEDDDIDPATLPAELAGRRALVAMQRLSDALRPTQGPHRTGKRLLAPDGHYEHAPLTPVALEVADLATLASAAAELRGAALPGGDRVVADALGDATRVSGCIDTRADIAAKPARLHGLLLAGDADMGALAEAVADDDDVVLTRDQEAAYQRTATRLNDAWAHGDALSRWAY